MDSVSNIPASHEERAIPKMTSIHSLSPEILECIFEYVHETSPSTISSLVLVAKFFYNSASNFRNRQQIFAFHNDNGYHKGMVAATQEKIHELIVNPEKAHTLKGIRCLTIKSDNGWKADASDPTSTSPDDELETKWWPMAKLIKLIANLKEVTFQGYHPMPMVLLDALEKYHPRARLHVSDWTRKSDDTDHNDPAEMALARSPNLRSIQASFWNGPGFDLRLPALKRIVALSPNLESVDMLEGQAGCLIYGHSSEDWHEQARRGRLFDVDNPSSNSIKSLKSSGKDHVACLQDVTDISKLESLDIENFYDPAYFSKDGVPNSRFPSLKHLSISSVWCWDESKKKGIVAALESFLVSCNPLTSLALSDYGSCGSLKLSSILAPHRSSIRFLKLHSSESSTDETKRQMLSMDDIQTIKDLCPMLEDITLDINRSEDGSTEREVISTLATFTNLKVIRFYIDIGLATEGSRPSRLFDSDTPEPNLPTYEANPFHAADDHWIQNFWSLFRSEKIKNNSTPLKELHIKVGEWERKMGGGYPAHWVTWEQSNQSYTIATLTDRDDRPGEIFVERKAQWGGEKPVRTQIPKVIRPSRLVKRKTAHELMMDNSRKRLNRIL